MKLEQLMEGVPYTLVQGHPCEVRLQVEDIHFDIRS